MQAVASILLLIWMAMAVTAIIGLIRGHIDWLRLRTRKAAALLLVASLPVFVATGLSAPKRPHTTKVAAPTSTIATTVPTTLAVTAAAVPTTTEAPPTTPPSVAATTSSVQAAVTSTPIDTTTPTPVGNPNLVSCAEVGGVFVAHGTDGRGDCEPADQRSHCHVPPAQQDGNYVADFIMDPPFPTGTINLMIARVMLSDATNADCWHLPTR